MTSRFAGLSKVLTAFVVLALLAALFLVFSNGGRNHTLSADFASANSLYKGGEVRILGVKVGKITEVEARGDRVNVTMEVDGDVKIPADVKAVEVSPAIVGDRFVQLAPAYTGGQELADGAHIGLNRTRVPIELDDIFKSVDSLAIALGPKGANKDGALSRLVKTTATQFDGQGEQFAETLDNFGKLSTTLNSNQDALFSSIDEVNKFVVLLRRNDRDVRQFFDSTARVSDVLAGERNDLVDTIKALAKALKEVKDFVQTNRYNLRANLDNLESTADVLADHANDIDQVLHDAPVAFANLAAAGGGPNGTLDARTDLGELLQNIGLANGQGQVFPALLNQIKMLLGIPEQTATADAAESSGPAGEPATTSPDAVDPQDVAKQVSSAAGNVLGQLGNVTGLNLGGAN